LEGQQYDSCQVARVYVLNQQSYLAFILTPLSFFQILEMDIPSWHKMYTDLPSKQLKVPVTNKSIVSCSEDETSVTSPPALQDELNRLMGETPLGRCFVRPSGTEDVMRVYAEGSTQEDADRLALKAVEAINRFVG
jgi:phosphoacetylglucosamine mutase